MSIGYAAVGLFMPKNPINVGQVLRAAGCYGAALVCSTGRRYAKAPTDTHNTAARIPFQEVDDLRTVIPRGCVPVAVDIIAGGVALPSYDHPPRAFYIFGPEDGTLGRDVTAWCRDVVFVPTYGCMNLAACVNVVLYDRAVKRSEWPERRVH